MSANSPKQDRTYTRTATDLERKYNFGKAFAEALGLIDESRDHVESVESSLRNEMEDQETTIMRDTEQIVMEATRDVVRQTEFEEFKQSSASNFRVMADNIAANVKQTTENTDAISDLWETSEADFQILSDEISLSVSSSTDLIEKTASEIGEALEQYVETSDYERYKESVKTSLQVLENEILMKFDITTEQITNVDGEYQRKFNELYNYISIVGGTMTFGSSENNVTLSIENDKIAIMRNGVTAGYWDADYFYTGNIVVRLNERLQVGNFAWVPRSNGNVSWLKVGG